MTVHNLLFAGGLHGSLHLWVCRRPLKTAWGVIRGWTHSLYPMQTTELNVQCHATRLTCTKVAKMVLKHLYGSECLPLKPWEDSWRRRLYVHLPLNRSPQLQKMALSKKKSPSIKALLETFTDSKSSSGETFLVSKMVYTPKYYRIKAVTPFMKLKLVIDVHCHHWCILNVAHP